MADMIEPARQLPESWRERMLLWLFNQSIPTLLLFLILLGIHYNIPIAMQHIDDVDRRNSEEQRRLQQSYERVIERLILKLEEERERDFDGVSIESETEPLL